MAVTSVPEGYHAVTPYLTVKDVPKLIDFLKTAFGGEEVERMAMPDGTVMHAEVRVGDSVVMMGEAGRGYPAMPAMLYLYVGDCDSVYKRAIQAGAKSLTEPADQFYGDRNGGVEDCCGNRWWIAQRKENLTTDEIRRRAVEAANKVA